MSDNLALFGNKVLRSAIRQNRVSFPAQAPVFVKQSGGEVQSRIALLYFVRGWTIRDIAVRYQMTSEMTRKTLNDWRVRAISSGYIQEIEPDGGEHPVLEILPGCPSETENDSETREVRPKTFSLVTKIPMPMTSPNWQTSLSEVQEMLLDEIDRGARTSNRWPAVCLQFLDILKQDCQRRGLHFAAAQIDRIVAAEVRDVTVARDLLRDLRVRILDENRIGSSTLCADYTPELLSALMQAVNTTLREVARSESPMIAMWPAYCSRLLAAIKEGCSKLGLRLTAAQVTRIEDAVSGDPHAIDYQIRDFSNRMVDEIEYKKLVDRPQMSQRQLTVGVG